MLEPPKINITSPRSRSPRSCVSSRPNSRASQHQQAQPESPMNVAKPAGRPGGKSAPNRRTLYTPSGIWGWVSGVESEVEVLGPDNRTVQRPASEGPNRLPGTNRHAAWNNFSDEIKSIDDQTVYFRNKKIKLKYSDTFKLVLDEIEYTPPSLQETSAESQNGNTVITSPLPQVRTTVVADEHLDISSAVTDRRLPEESHAKVKNQEETNKTGVKNQQESVKNDHDQETELYDWDTKQIRNILYERYLKKPNAWLDGFSYIPPEFTEKYGKFSTVEITPKRGPKRKAKSATLQKLKSR